MRKLQKGWKHEKLRDLLENELLLFELELEADEELLEMFYPMFNQDVRVNEMKLFNKINNAVEIEVSGMGGASLRGSKDSTVNLLERQGYSGGIVIDYVDEFESKVLEEYYRNANDDKK